MLDCLANDPQHHAEEITINHSCTASEIAAMRNLASTLTGSPVTLHVLNLA